MWADVYGDELKPRPQHKTRLAINSPSKLGTSEPLLGYLECGKAMDEKRVLGM
jgi:hypothetical protein